MEPPVLHQYLHLSLYEHSGHRKVISVDKGKELLRKYNIPKKFRKACLEDLQKFGLIEIEEDNILFKQVPEEDLSGKEIITYINNNVRPRHDIYNF